jgi:hypothetical protein
MRRVKLFLSLLSCLLWAPSLGAVASGPSCRDVSGYFLPHTAEESAEESARAAGFEWLQLWCDSSPGGEPRLEGSLRFDERLATGEFLTIPLSTLTLAGQQLSFSAVREGGPEYRFTGRFLQSGRFEDVAENETDVLAGVLEVLAGGKVARTVEVHFHYTAGD